MNRYRPHPSAVATELGEEVVALQLDTKRYYTLNPTAACAWRALTRGASSCEVRDALTAEFAIEPSDAMPYVDTLLEQLLALELIVPCNAGSPPKSP